MMMEDKISEVQFEFEIYRQITAKYGRYSIIPLPLLVPAFCFTHTFRKTRQLTQIETNF